MYDSRQCAQQNKWQLPVCWTKYTSKSSVQQNTTRQWAVACVRQIHDSCQGVQQNIFATASVFNKIYDSCQYVQQNTPHCVDSVQQHTPDSEQSIVSNNIYGSGHSVQQNIVDVVKMWVQVIDDCHRPWQTRCKVVCQPTSLTDGQGFYDYVLMSPLPGTVAAAVNF